MNRQDLKDKMPAVVFRISAHDQLHMHLVAFLGLAMFSDALFYFWVLMYVITVVFDFAVILRPAILILVFVTFIISI
jgi:hypothetical protein